jgi:hypothetical protein
MELYGVHRVSLWPYRTPALLMTATIKQQYHTPALLKTATIKHYHTPALLKTTTIKQH